MFHTGNQYSLMYAKHIRVPCFHTIVSEHSTNRFAVVTLCYRSVVTMDLYGLVKVMRDKRCVCSDNTGISTTVNLGLDFCCLNGDCGEAGRYNSSCQD